MNGSAKIHRNVTESDLDALPVSPKKVYRVSFHWDSADEEYRKKYCGTDEKCQRGFSFQWLRDDDAIVSFTCTSMEEKVIKCLRPLVVHKIIISCIPISHVARLECPYLLGTRRIRP